MILAPMILIIDNYDSFTWNLAHLIGGLGRSFSVVRNDKISAAEATSGRYAAVVISPGPGGPEEAGVSMDVVTAARESRTPVFGVCLGLQSIAKALGGDIIRASQPMHGKISRLRHSGTEFFAGLPQSFPVARYHSLVAAPETLPQELTALAFADNSDEVMAAAHKTLPIAGVQFHPESIATEHGAKLVDNFFAWAKRRG